MQMITGVTRWIGETSSWQWLERMFRSLWQ